jgi:signal transduction histidine kinase
LSNLNRLLELWGKPGDSEEVPEILEECREGVERVGSIVSGLLSLARRSDGRADSVDMIQVIETTLPIIRREAIGRAQLTMQLLPVRPVIGDPRLLGQVVLNLVMNALQSLPEGRSDGNRVTILIAPEEGGVRLSVIDTGTGIPDDLLPRVFDPFVTTQRGNEGVGLGLAITHQIVERHRGSIDIDTSETGTTVTVHLPRAAGSNSTAPDEIQAR